jgi:alkaline phosphatase D
MPFLSVEDHDHRRRAFIRAFGASAALLFGPPLLAQRAVAQGVSLAEFPFTLGVASGDPSPDGFVIWTRLAPRPFEIGFGLPSVPIEVRWELATDEAFTATLRSGTAIASPQLAHSVHVEIDGLPSGRPYWYRFTAGGHISATGRARTAPPAGSTPARVRFGVAGCQSYEAGLFTAHRHLAAEDLDFVFCYGDYIYENAGRTRPQDAPDMRERIHFGGEIYSVDDYRRRYAQYRLDADLQAAHAAHPWFVVWDDHETDNNWASAFDEKNTPAPIFALRRQAAVQAYYEHMPLRLTSFPSGTAMQLYRRASYGRTLDLHFLDTRQYRSNQPCNDVSAGCREVDAADAEFLGAEQERWLLAGLSQSKAAWNALAQQMMMMDLDRDPGAEIRYNIDSWAGYRRPRERVLSHIRDRRISDVVVLTGDEHVNYAGDLHIDGRDPGERAIANEFVATSIASGGDGQDISANAAGVLSANPQLKFINTQRGYLTCEVTTKAWTTDFRVIDRVTARGGRMSVRKRLSIERGSAELSGS